jgi:hypothetical protein
MAVLRGETASRAGRADSRAKHRDSRANIVIAAVQRGWRDFRMATCSRDRDDATLPKIWTPRGVAHSRTNRRLAMNQHAAVGKFSHVKPTWRQVMLPVKRWE